MKIIVTPQSDISDKSIARVFFTVIDGMMVLLHGIKKKSQKTPENELKLAKERKNQVLNDGRK